MRWLPSLSRGSLARSITTKGFSKHYTILSH
jgi:hypothetical protein